MNDTLKSKRRLATIESITSISPIPEADKIVLSRVRGWNVVTGINDFKVGDTCIYIEVDSFLPTNDERFAFLAKRGVRKDASDAEGYLIKTAQLRGVLSQGLALPLALFPEVEGLEVGSDVTELLNIIIWEPKIPDELMGSVNGVRPSWIPATDEDRIQNVEGILTQKEVDWIATEKIDGTSTTFYVDSSENNLEGSCSRNYDLTRNPDVTLWKLAEELEIHRLIKETYPNSRVAVQGETFGSGIQGNPLKIKDRRFAAFTLRVDYEEVPRNQWPEWLLAIAVPVHDLAFPNSVEEALESVNSLKSKINPSENIEGIVWRARDTASLVDESGINKIRASFKVISNSYLLKHDR